MKRIEFLAPTHVRKSIRTLKKNHIIGTVPEGTILKVKGLTIGPFITDTHGGITKTSNQWYVGIRGKEELEKIEYTKNSRKRYYWAGWVKPADKTVTFNVDDYGVHDYIDLAIRNAASVGLIDSVSTFTTFENSSEKILKLLEHPVKIGLHFTITAGSPVMGNNVKTLIQGPFGKFATLDTIRLWRPFKRLLISKGEFEDELRAQLKVLEDIVGIDNVDHINVHQNIVYFLDDLWQILLKVAAEKGIPVRSPFTYESQHKEVKRRIKKNLNVNTLPINRRASDMFFDHLQNQFPGYTAQNIAMAINYTNMAKKQLLARAKLIDVKVLDNCVSSYYGKPNFSTIKEVLENIEDGERVEFMLHLADENTKLDDVFDNEKFWGIKKASLLTRPSEYNILKKHKYKIDALLKKHEIIRGSYKDILMPKPNYIALEELEDNDIIA